MAEVRETNAMTAPPEDMSELVLRLAAMPHETEWLEFKGNNKDLEKIGETIAALANSAALHGQKSGYLIWGVTDATHEIVGTAFQPRATKYSGQDLEHFLSTQLKPHTNFAIHELTVGGKPVVVFTIEPARYAPIAYRGQDWIRIGSHNKPLREFTSIERRLWQAFEKAAFDTAIAASGLTEKDVGNLLWYKDFFISSRGEPPVSVSEAMPRLVRSKLVCSEGNGRFGITNLGALLFAKNLDHFETLRRKKLRVIFYKGPTKTESYEERPARRGYASSFRP
ncbi:MAG TPA: RNA-binding domain-containing protein, partial [Thermoanaerobaculia bacterium]|nr:RNA-binding domain-containing protein [Thermoanaerobaculia bacterium]